MNTELDITPGTGYLRPVTIFDLRYCSHLVNIHYITRNILKYNLFYAEHMMIKIAWFLGKLAITEATYSFYKKNKL